MQFVFKSFPRRRERHLHIGLIAYGRKMNKVSLPRAITFTGSFYSLGVPPEFLDIGAILKLKGGEFILVNKYYKNYLKNLNQAGKFLNWGNLEKLSKKSKNWLKIKNNIEKVGTTLKIKFGPKTQNELKHSKLTSLLLQYKNNNKKVKKLITETGILRRSLG